MEPCHLRVPVPIRSDTAGLNSRIRKLEDMLQRSDTVQTPSTFLATYRIKKERAVDEYVTELETKFYTSVTLTFDLSNRKSLLPIIKSAVVFVADNAIGLAQVTGYAITGSMRFDLVVRILCKLFADIGEAVMSELVQHTWEITYHKCDDARTIQLLENKVSNLEIGEKTSPVKSHRSLARFLCFKSSN